jgi:hypothetical protein
MWGKMWKLAATFTHDDNKYSLDAAINLLNLRSMNPWGNIFEGPGNIHYDEKVAFTKYGYNGTDPGGTAISGAVPQANTDNSVFNWCWNPGVPRKGTYPGISQ